MTLRTRPLLSRLTVAATALGLLFLPLVVAPAEATAQRDRDQVTVMTRNIYLGADIQRPIRATVGKTGLEALVALGNANHVTRTIVDQTSFPVRSELLADEIADAAPDLVGLQEVALWRSGPLELPPPLGTGGFGELNAETVDYDFLQILLQDLRQEGVPYKAVVVQVESDVEAPSFEGVPGTPSFASQRDVRLTMRDVVLLRASSNLRVVDRGSDQYDTKLVLPVVGMDMEFVRGYTWVDVQHGSGEAFRFVNTHLEAFSSDIALGQAVELVTEAADPGKTTIIACDCNSDPLDDSVKPTDPLGTPHSGPYNFIRGVGGFTDMWLEWAPAEEGWTSGLSETVDDATAAGFDHRIDMIFARTATGDVLEVLNGEVTGDEVTDRDPATGLWPSDHAGVVLTLGGVDN